MFQRPMPLRTQLALGYSIFFAVILCLLSTGVYLTVRSTLYHEVSEQLQTSSDLIQQDFDDSNNSLQAYFDTPEFLLRSHPPRVEGLETPSLYVQADDLNGKEVVRSSSLQSLKLPLSSQDRAAIVGGKATHTMAQLSSGRVYIIGRPLVADQQTVGILLVAQSLQGIDRTLELLLTSLVVVNVLALITAIRAGTWLARRALEPVEVITHTAHQIVRAEHLAQRVPEAPVDDEIGHLTRTINEMLARLEELFTAQQRFVADVSHELRTPLTAMRGNLEVLRRNAISDPREIADSLTDMQREVERLTMLTNDLLVLAQPEDRVVLRKELVALDELVLEIVRELRPLAHNVSLKPRIAQQVAVRGDRGRLKQALLNLAANAIQHTPADGIVQIALSQNEEDALLSVQDSGYGIAPEDIPHIFERFYRGDKARSRRAGGAGLGLAIVQWVANAHGGRVSVTSTLGEGSTFTLTLPLAVAPQTSPVLEEAFS